MTDRQDGTIDQIESRTEQFHYSTIHTALEQHLDRDLPGSITRIDYPSEDGEKGSATVHFAEVVEREV